MLKLKVSVIIPTYNRASYLVEAIESALSQTYKDFEIIIVDDGSTDNTREVVERYIKSQVASHRLQDKIKYFYQNNSGPAAARNTGIKE